MSRASIDTLLSLGRFQEIMGINPWYFNQLYTTTYTGAGDCDPFWLQYAWMDADKVGREDLARAIVEAEADIAKYLSYWPAPKWFTNEDHLYLPHHDKQLFGIYGIDHRGQGKGIRSDWGYIRSVGQKATSLIQAGVAVAYSGDTATISVATTVTDGQEIHVYFRTTDGADAAKSDTYRVRPLRISISGGTATITGKKWLFVKPSLWESEATLNEATAANFVSAVDIYRVYNDPSDPADFYWETLPEGCSDTDNSGCQYSTQTACLLIRNAQMGFLVPNPAEWDADDEAFTEKSFAEDWEPDKVRINYRAGYPIGSDGEMDDSWARAVAYYAAAILGRESCDCAYFGRFLRRWQEDLTLNTSSQSRLVAQHKIDNPFGTERGAIFAWEKVKKSALGEGFAL